MSKILTLILNTVNNRKKSFSLKKPAKRVHIRSGDSSHDVYDPKKCSVGELEIEEFIRTPLSRDIESIPGVESTNKAILRKSGIAIPHQLLAVYLSMCKLTADPVEICDRFYFWIEEIGISFNLSLIHI